MISILSQWLRQVVSRRINPLHHDGHRSTTASAPCRPTRVVMSNEAVTLKDHNVRLCLLPFLSIIGRIPVLLPMRLQNARVFFSSKTNNRRIRYNPTKVAHTGSCRTVLPNELARALGGFFARDLLRFLKRLGGHLRRQSKRRQRWWWTCLQKLARSASFCKTLCFAYQIVLPPGLRPGGRTESLLDSHPLPIVSAIPYYTGQSAG